MQIGVVYPQTELSVDPASVREYVSGVEAFGYRHLVVFDHVLGADPAVHQGWSGPYDVDTTFHEPLVLFGYLAAITKLELVTAVIIAPQRQTALLAKQAAEVDLLSEGRLRLGIGVGWNRVEYEALGQDFTTRGKREEEQVELLRRLFTERSVSFAGEFDTVTGAGIAPLPVRRPIPIWLGGRSAPTYRRVGRLADGWFPQIPIGPELSEARDLVASSALAVGRDPATIGMEVRVTVTPGSADALLAEIAAWQAAGATHLSVNTMGVGLSDLAAHLDALGVAARALGLGG